jgi:hypothetical protein
LNGIKKICCPLPLPTAHLKAVAGVTFASLGGPSHPELQINAANAMHSKFTLAQKEKRAIF